jgi:hypothetical protein
MTPTIAELILSYGLKYGPEVLAHLVEIFSKPGGPTADDWTVLIQKCQTTGRMQMLDLFAAHGIDPNSDQGKAFLALVGS